MIPELCGLSPQQVARRLMEMRRVDPKGQRNVGKRFVLSGERLRTLVTVDPAAAPPLSKSNPQVYSDRLQLCYVCPRVNHDLMTCTLLKRHYRCYAANGANRCPADPPRWGPVVVTDQIDQGV